MKYAVIAVLAVALFVGATGLLSGKLNNVRDASNGIGYEDSLSD